MKKIIFSFLFGLMGCASIGQLKYNGTRQEPFVVERIVHLPDAPKLGIRSGGSLYGYWDLPVDKVVEATNPLSKSITVQFKCRCSFPSEVSNVIIPPRTTQEVLITTNATYMYDNLCDMYYEVNQ